MASESGRRPNAPFAGGWRTGPPWPEAMAGGQTVPRLEVRFLAVVTVQDGESLESALRRFKRKVQQEDIIKDAKKHSFYLKPGERRRLKQALARKRARKKSRSQSR